MVDTLGESFQEAGEFVVAQRQHDFFQRVEASGEEPQVGVHHGTDVGVGILFEEISQQRFERDDAGEGA